MASRADHQGNTYRAIRPLVDAEFLIEVSDTKRNQMWRAPDALDAFANRAGRGRPAFRE